MWKITEDYEDYEVLVDEIGILDAGRLAIEHSIEIGEDKGLKQPKTVLEAIDVLNKCGYNVEMVGHYYEK